MENLTLLALLRDLQLKVNQVEKGIGPSGIQGPTGRQGPKGDTGADGVQGLRGPQGLPGSDGLSGPQGEAGQDGEDGVGIESVSEAADGEIVFTLTDGSEHSVNLVGGLTGPSGGSTMVQFSRPDPQTFVAPTWIDGGVLRLNPYELDFDGGDAATTPQPLGGWDGVLTVL